MRISNSTSKIAVAVALAGGLCAGTVAVATATPDAGQQSATKTAALPSGLAAAFAKPAGPSDTESGPVRGTLASNGAGIQAVRAVGAKPGLYAAKADDGLCAAVDAGSRGAAVYCTPLETINEAGWVGAQTSTSDGWRITGFVADGVTTVSVATSKGDIPVEVVDSTIDVTVAGTPTGLQLQRGGRTQGIGFRLPTPGA